MATNVPVVVGTLHTSGWVTNSLEALDFILAHFFEVQNSQYRFMTGVVSFQSLLAKNGDNFGQLTQDVRQALFGYLSTKFTNVEMTVNVTPNNGDQHSAEWTLNIQCDFMDSDGKSYSLGRAVEMYGKQFKRINQLNVTGKLP